MPYSVSFTDFTPPPRYDGIKWASVKIEESDQEIGPWTLIETLAITPLDIDPANPQKRNFTTNNATLETGWYRLTFIDQDGAFLQPTTPIHNVPDEAQPWMPTVGDIGNLMRSRTKDSVGNEIGTFTDKTRPKYEQVVEVIRTATDDVISETDTDIPAEAYRLARTAIKYKAAMLIELSYFPEQVQPSHSPYEHYRQLYMDAMKNLLIALAREESEELYGEAGVPVYAQWTFPDEEEMDW
jgi:hypothetical protein